MVGSQQTITNFVLVRLNPDLSFDTAFNSTGIVKTAFSAGIAQANGIVIDPNGKITASGGQNGASLIALRGKNAKSDKRAVAVGMAVTATPRTDPCLRRYRTRFLLRMRPCGQRRKPFVRRGS